MESLLFNRNQLLARFLNTWPQERRWIVNRDWLQLNVTIVTLGEPWGDTIVRFWKRSRPEQTRPRLECRTKVSSTSISCQTLSQGLSKSLCAHPSATIGGAICSDNTLGGIVRATFDGKNRLLLWGFHLFDLSVITTPTIINVEEPFLLNLVTSLDVYHPVLSSPLPFE